MKAFQWTIAAAAAVALSGCGGDGFLGFGGQDDAGAGSSAQQQEQQGQGAPIAASSSLVRDVQQALKSEGIHDGAVDGVWGERTQQAVREFQQKQGLQATGQLDEQTLSALGVASEASGGAAAGGSPSGEQQK